MCVRVVRDQISARCNYKVATSARCFWLYTFPMPFVRLGQSLICFATTVITPPKVLPINTLYGYIYFRLPPKTWARLYSHHHRVRRVFFFSPVSVCSREQCGFEKQSECNVRTHFKQSPAKYCAYIVYSRTHIEVFLYCVVAFECLFGISYIVR